MDKRAKVSERLAFLLNPEKGAEKYARRIRDEKLKERGRGGARMATDTGYGKHGASRTLNSMVGWLVGGGSAEEDVDLNASLLRRRSRDLFAGGGLARSGMVTLNTNVVGWGIIPKPKIDAEALGMSEEQKDEWERKALREFKLWAENRMCDAERQLNFYGLQQLAFLSMLMSGDCFVLFGEKENRRTPYRTVIRLLEADRVCQPESDGESESEAYPDGSRIVDGVRVSADGEVLSYFVANQHPLLQDTERETKWVEVPAFGEETGMPNVLHVMTQERPGQRRGVPFVAANMEDLKQLQRYLTSELAANVVSSYLSLFVTTEEDDGKAGLEDAVNPEDKVTDDDLSIELGPGVVYELPPGKKISEMNPVRSNTAFKDFVETMETIVGSSMDIPKEVLTKRYESNYTAARGALLDFWRTVRVHRTRFNQMFNQPIYEAWLAEAVALGRLDAPGFFDDPAIRSAWCGCLWMGASMGHVDPKKEVEAAVMRIDNFLTTAEQEASEYNGNDFNANVIERRREIAQTADILRRAAAAAAATDEGEGETDDAGSV